MVKLNRKVRIGIDVGGTFTDAVVIDNQTNRIIAKEKIKTTHTHTDGVAKGITDIVAKILDENDISPSNVTFIAHATTQATNALLEGDVAKVGVIGMASSKSDVKRTTVEAIELADEKYLDVEYEYLLSSEINKQTVKEATDNLINKNVDVIVASEAYSIENPTNELFVSEEASKRGYYTTSGHVISQLFGLKIRTRTAIINGSLIPTMMETADMTEQVVKEIGIPSDLMIMRADGGVMSVSEMRKRPILTMLSGLAAGVAGVLMHEKVSEGIFLEIGGTSIDISVIKDGKVMLKNAQIGENKTYLKSLDIRTLGIAGGTMIRVKNHSINEIGPRSAHLAGLPYEAFEQHAGKKMKIDMISPLESDPEDYVVGEDAEGQRYAYTLAGAANYLELIEEDDYAYAAKADFGFYWDKLGEYCGTTGKEVAKQALKMANEKIWTAIKDLIDDYELDQEFITLVGGGGSASVLTRALGEQYNLRYKIAKNAPYISTIGVALAMVREEIERSVVNPTEEDIKKIRMEVVDKLISMGALEDTIEVSVHVDSSKHIIKAVATGSTEFNQEEKRTEKISDEESVKIAANALGASEENVIPQAKSAGYRFLKVQKPVRGLKKIFKRSHNYQIVMNNEGIIKYRREDGNLAKSRKKDCKRMLQKIYDNFSTYSDGGEAIPEILLFCGSRVFDYSGLISKQQIEDMIKMDLELYGDNKELFFLVTRR